MAGSDEETVEVGFNKEPRLCGLARDDVDDDFREDREAPFHHHADDHIIDVKDGDVLTPARAKGEWEAQLSLYLIKLIFC